MSTAQSNTGTTTHENIGDSMVRRIPNLSTVVWRSLVGFRALHFALAAGIAAATAVIVGALVVGDSVRGSLRTLVLERLGQIDGVLVTQRFFNPDFLEAATDGIGSRDHRLLPAILIPSVAVELQKNNQMHRAAQVQAIGIDENALQSLSADKSIQKLTCRNDEVILNAQLATQLGAEVGDEVTLRFPKGTGVPADSPLGRRDDASANLPRQKVVAILPDHSVGGLDLRASQQNTLNVFVSLASMQDALQQDGKVNAAFAVIAPEGREAQRQEADKLCKEINDRMKPELSDFGLKLTRHTRMFPDESIGEKSDEAPKKIFDYFQITSEQLIIDEVSQRAIFEALRPYGVRRCMSYLINEISAITAEGQVREPSVTYSIAVGLEDVDTNRGVQFDRPMPWDARPTACWINSWLAERLDIKNGDTLRMTYYRPETIEGREVEVVHDAVVIDTLPITQPSKGYVRNKPAIFDNPPTEYNDPDLTPVVPGITDQDSISKWDLPFELTRKVPPEDDEYWKDYRLTPKIFLRYSSAARYFGSRFGSTTAFRIDASHIDEATLRSEATNALRQQQGALGFQFLPIRLVQLKAASGTTPFDGLFLALSFFVIVAALMLVALLFRLSIEQRSSQWGLMLATGFSHQRVRSVMLRESIVVVVAGVAIGALIGLGYARLMIAGLENWWVGAISISFLQFQFTARSLAIGAAIGAVSAIATIFWSLSRLKSKAPLDLLRGQWSNDGSAASVHSKVPLAVAGFLLFGAVGLLALGFTQTGMSQAGSFFGCGMLLLAGTLTAAMYWLRAPQIQPGTSTAKARRGLLALAWSSMTRNPWRSVLTVGLLSSASFLIASMSIFQIAPNIQGSGGFELIAESSLPIYRDLGSTRTREEVLSTEDFNTLSRSTILSFRSRPGEDASCNNLYQVTQPTVLGVPDILVQYQMGLAPDKRFQWAAHEASEEAPWNGLFHNATGEENDPIPVVMDLNTAAWSLHQGASLGAITKVPFDDKMIYFKTIGLLSNSVLQGKLLIAETNFTRLFPQISGYRYFMIHPEDTDLAQATAALENGWSDEGLDAFSSADVLSKLLGVQNTYISAFQSIGALGLLLGTIGLAVVQIRSVLERRKEFALMQAVGFSRGRIASLLLCEASLLLIGGMTIGVLSALIAIVPYAWNGNSGVNYWQPIMMLIVVLAVGFLASLIAVVTAARQPILANLQARV